MKMISQVMFINVYFYPPFLRTTLMAPSQKPVNPDAHLTF